VTIDFSDVPWWIVLLGLELPAVLALVDCIGRPVDHFAGGAEDRQAWIRWLVVAVVTVPILVGFLLLIGYYHVVIRRNSPFSRGG
jgi:hypothetical protein